MSLEYNHTIAPVRDKHVDCFLADLLGLEVGADVGRFAPVQLANGVSLDYLTTSDFQPQHYAFLVSEDEFDAAFARIQSAGIGFYGEPGGGQPGQLNHRWGGRGGCFHDLDAHAMELLTRTA